MAGHLKKRKVAGSKVAPVSDVFNHFSFYFHGSISGAHTVLPDKICQNGGSVVGKQALQWAVQAECPLTHKDYGSRGRLEVVVIYEEKNDKVSSPSMPLRETRLKVGEEIKSLVRQSDLLCTRCGTCHILVCSSSKKAGVPFVVDSTSLGCAQTQLLVPLVGIEDTIPPGHQATQKKSKLMEQGPQPIIISDSDSDCDERQIAQTENSEGVATKTNLARSRDVSSVSPTKGNDVVLRHTQCPENACYVHHLELLSFLTKLNVCGKSVLKNDKDHAKVASWAFKQASNAVRRLPGLLYQC